VEDRVPKYLPAGERHLQPGSICLYQKTYALIQVSQMPVEKSMAHREVRIEHDLLSKKEGPAAAYYGVQTLRASENFKISSVPLYHYSELIRALSVIKMAAPRATFECRQSSREILTAMDGACEKNTLSAEQIQRILNPASMTGVLNGRR
jgi:hypothetical protein